jgi:hypothetical protein
MPTNKHTRRRLLKLGLRHFGTDGLAQRLKVSESVVKGWLDDRETIPDRRLIALIDLIDAKGALGDDA